MLFIFRESAFEDLPQFCSAWHMLSNFVSFRVPGLCLHRHGKKNFTPFAFLLCCIMITLLPCSARICTRQIM